MLWIAIPIIYTALIDIQFQNNEIELELRFDVYKAKRIHKHKRLGRCLSLTRLIWNKNKERLLPEWITGRGGRNYQSCGLII